MTPHEYATAIVVPTVREFLMERGDLRRAFLACVATYHLVDYLAHAHAASNSSKAASEKAKNEAAHEIRSAVRAVCALSFDVVQGICNGTKHADLIPTREAPIPIRRAGALCGVKGDGACRGLK